jgi:hypothetical protein
MLVGEHSRLIRSPSYVSEEDTARCATWGVYDSPWMKSGYEHEGPATSTPTCPELETASNARAKLTPDTTLSSSRTSFNTKFSSLLWVLTSGANWVLVWWYRKQPVFYLPPGWLPAPVAWLLSFPSAPRGEFCLSYHLRPLQVSLLIPLCQSSSRCCAVHARVPVIHRNSIGPS